MANSVDPDQMLCSAVPNLGLHCLQSLSVPILRIKKKKKKIYNSLSPKVLTLKVPIKVVAENILFFFFQ